MVVAKDLLKWKEFVAEMLGMKTFPLRVMRFSCSKTLKKCSAKISTQIVTVIIMKVSIPGPGPKQIGPEMKLNCRHQAPSS